jgi:hypothetical protein
MGCTGSCGACICGSCATTEGPGLEVEVEGEGVVDDEGGVEDCAADSDGGDGVSELDVESALSGPLPAGAAPSPSGVGAPASVVIVKAWLSCGQDAAAPAIASVSSTTPSLLTASALLIRRSSPWSASACD